MLSQIEVFKDFFEKSSKSKSTILRPLVWLIGILFSGAMMSFSLERVPFWLSIIFVLILIVSIFLYIGVYIYALIRNPDLLRSEDYKLTKMAIEKSFVGTDKTGLINSKAVDPPALSKDFEQ